jgi:signal transduction histidine kinase
VAKITVKDPNALELFEKVRETASNLDKMLVKLQSISDVGAQQLIYREVLLEELVIEIKDSFRIEIERKGIQFFSTINLTTPFHSYPALVKIILENLIENAIFFCGADQPKVVIEIFHQGTDVALQVTDNGQGIDEEVQGKIFDMYFRGNERSKGNGLGLYIVKKSVEKLQGSVSFETKLHVGSTFTVRLPNELS